VRGQSDHLIADEKDLFIIDALKARHLHLEVHSRRVP
jgi:hypothetical protein